MISQTAFIVSMLAFAACLFMAVGALLNKGLRGMIRCKKPLCIAFSIYAAAFVLYLVIQ